MNIFPVSTNISADVCGSLFGSTSILTLKAEDVWLCLGLSLVVLIFFVLFYNKIFSVTFDESFSKATGVNSDCYNLIIAIITAIIIVIAMNLVGSLLISALIIFPALSAMRVFKSFKSICLYGGFFQERYKHSDRFAVFCCDSHQSLNFFIRKKRKQNGNIFSTFNMFIGNFFNSFITQKWEKCG